MSTKFLNKSTAIATILSTLAFFPSCEKEKVVQLQLPPVDVEVTPLVHKDVPIMQEWIGSLRGTEDTEIRSQVTGYLLTKEYEDGSFVEKGAPLFQIDKRPFQASLNQAIGKLKQDEATFKKYNLDVQRYEPLVATGSVSRKQLDDAIQSRNEAAASIVTSKAQVEQALINLDFTTIKAPISGLIGIAKPSVGNLLSSTQQEALATISSIDPIRLDFAISEKDFLNGFSSAKGNQLKDVHFDIYLSNGVKYKFPATLISIDRNVDKQTGTIKLVANIPNPNHTLRPGMFIRIKATTSVLKNAALVPPRAIMSMQSASFIVGVNPDKTTFVLPVQPGPADGRLQVIEPVSAPIPEKMEVIVEGIMQGAQRAKTGGTVIPIPFADKITQPLIKTKGATNFDEEDKKESSSHSPAELSKAKETK